VTNNGKARATLRQLGTTVPNFEKFAFKKQLGITVSVCAVQLARSFTHLGSTRKVRRRYAKGVTGSMEFTLCYRLQYPILNQIRYDVFFRQSALLMQKVSPSFWTF
jgi:hypothetical protein